MVKSTVEKIKPGLQIEERLTLHEKGWAVQRVGWVIIFLVPVLGLLGLFGEGVISNQKETKGAIDTEFDRFYRYEKEMQIRVESATEHMPQIALPLEYLKNMRIIRINPEPENRVAEAGNIVYQFAGHDNRQITFYVTPQTVGSIDGVLSVNNQTFSLHHFIFP